MSWAAHEFESIVLHHHASKRRLRISYPALLLGCLLPDLMTKLPVYGWNVGPVSLKASVPWRYHRGWPGVGFTHTLAFGIVVALLVYWVWHNAPWALGLLLGQWSHVLTDAFDSTGTMLWFPFTTQRYSIGLWRYSASMGRYGDAASYYSGWGGLWDVLWLSIALLFSRRALTQEYFDTEVAPHDPFWGWLRRRWHVRSTTMAAIYRAFFLYGAFRVAAWSLWARISYRSPIDLSLGGPRWVPLEGRPNYDAMTLARTAYGVAGLALASWILWVFVARPMAIRSGDLMDPAVRSVGTVVMAASPMADAEMYE